MRSSNGHQTRHENGELGELDVPPAGGPLVGKTRAKRASPLRDTMIGPLGLGTIYSLWVGQLSSYWFRAGAKGDEGDEVVTPRHNA